MNFDSTEPQPNMFLRFSASFMAFAACCCIFLLPREDWASYVKLSACLFAAGLYFASSWNEGECNKGWKMSFSLGIIWLFNASIHLLVLIASNLPKTE